MSLAMRRKIQVPLIVIGQAQGNCTCECMTMKEFMHVSESKTVQLRSSLINYALGNWDNSRQLY